MFIGQYFHTLDEKNRIIIPTKFRSSLGENGIITIGYDKCLTIYTEQEWMKLQEKLLTMKDNQSDSRKHVRLIVGSASECSFDSHGRVILPQVLIDRIELKKDVVLVGNIDHIEIWSKENWMSYYDDAYNTFDEVAEKLEL